MFYRNSMMRVALVIALLAIACGAAPDGPVAIETATSRATVCPLVRSGGYLVADATWGLAVRDANGMTYGVVWPMGWTAHRESGRILLLDAVGAIQAREGDHLVFDSALSESGVLHPCNWVAVAPEE
jgi:hypothetical protein